MAVERKTAGRILIKSASFNYSAIDSRAIYSSTGCIGPSAQRTQPRARCHSSFDSATLDSSHDSFFPSHFALPSFSLPYFLDSALSTHDIRPAKISSLPSNVPRLSRFCRHGICKVTYPMTREELESRFSPSRRPSLYRQTGRRTSRGPSLTLYKAVDGRLN